MSDSANVIRLEPDAQRYVRSRMARLPAVVHALHDVGKKALDELLVEYFDASDDAMFDLADKALCNQEQNMYFDSMRELRVQRKGIEHRFFDVIEDSFARLVGADSREDALDSGELSADALSLVLNEDLEQLVALDETVDRANKACFDNLYGLSQAMSSIVATPVAVEQNPFAPGVVSRAIMFQIKRLDVDVKAKLMMFKVFDEQVVQQLPSLYQQLFGVLAEHGIDLSQLNVVDAEAATGNKVSESETLNTSVDELLELLSLVQTLPMEASPSQALDIHEVLAGVQVRRGKPMALACIELETIKLVQMLFQFILDNDSLDQQMTGLFCRMQVPLVKVALLDETFLTRQRHPARLLINELASVALQCSGEESSQVSPDDPMFVLMKRTVDRITHHFDKNIDIFKEALVDFSAFVEQLNRRAAVLEKRTVDAEAGKAKVEQARMTVSNELVRCMEGYQLPGMVVRLIEGPWSNVLFVAGLKHGFTSYEWEGQLKVLNDLIWSVQPCTNKNEKQRLVVLIPGLIANLRLGLDSISYNPFEVAELFKNLEEVHLARMRGGSVAGELDAGIHEPLAEGEEPHTGNPVGESLEPNGDSDLGDVAESRLLPEHDPHMKMVAEFTQGAWFGFQADALDGEDVECKPRELLRCRLAAIIKQADKYIFVNRSGMKVTEKTQQALALALKDGFLRPLDSSLLFDKALESVVTGLRKSAASMPGLRDSDRY